MATSNHYRNFIIGHYYTSKPGFAAVGGEGKHPMTDDI